MLVLFLDVVVVFLVVAVPCSCGVWAQATKPRPERPAGKAACTRWTLFTGSGVEGLGFNRWTLT